MSREIIYSDNAMFDIIDYAYNIAETSLSASKRFTKAVNNAAAQLAERPGLGVVRDYNNPVNAGMRMWPIPGFAKYLLFYKATEDELFIVRVVHGSRDIQTIFGVEEEEE